MSLATRSPAPTAASPAVGFTPGFVRLLQLALTLLIAVYMLFIGGTFDAAVRYQVQLFNTVGAALLGLAWLAMRARGPRVLPTDLEWPLAAFALSQWLALLTSAQPRLGLEWAAQVTFWSLALLIVCDALRSGWPREFVVQGLVLMAALVTLLGLIEATVWYAGWLRAGQWPPYNFRLTGWLGNANLTAAFLLLHVPLVLALAARSTHTGRRLGFSLLALGMLAVLFFTSSRGGWVGCAAGLAAFGALAVLGPHGRAYLPQMLLRWRSVPATGRWFLGLGILAPLGLAGYLLTAQAEHVSHLPLVASREIFWVTAWRMFQLQPLTGTGPDLFPWFYTRWVAAPPGWFAPHAHSLPLQILSGSGLMGLGALLWLVAAAGWHLARRWRTATDPLLLAGLAGGLIAFSVHQVFDYLLGSPVVVFAVVMMLALALSEVAPQSLARSYLAPALAMLMVGLIAVAGFALRGAALNSHGLSLADEGNWAGAASAFEQAAAFDPGLTLYWQQAAYAYTRAGDLAAALPLWQRAAHDDPYWPLLPASAAMLTGDRAALAAADAIHGGSSHLLALNLGLLAEQAGNAPTARADYARALALHPSSARAIFWHQTPLRRALLADWQADQAADPSALVTGQALLAAGDFEEAVQSFQDYLDLYPANHLAYAGLAAAYVALDDLAKAEVVLSAGLRAPVSSPAQTAELQLVAGDLARARGDDAAAAEAYRRVFSVVNDYTVFGPGTFGYPLRAWYVFRRHALPADLVEQFVRADITAAMDARFTWLAAHTAAHGQASTACYLVERVVREAPDSEAGAYWRANCQ